jgi:hypothetical protein
MKPVGHVTLVVEMRKTCRFSVRQSQDKETRRRRRRVDVRIILKLILNKYGVKLWT